MVIGTWSDPNPSFKFGLEIGGILVAGFTSISGLEYSRQTKEVAEGGVNDFVHVLPGPMQHGRIRLSRGITFTSFLWEWFHWGMHDGSVLRLPVIIINYATSGLPVKIWPILDAYPVKWVGQALDAATNEAAIEALEIAFGGRRSGGGGAQRLATEGGPVMAAESGGLGEADQQHELARRVVKLLKDTLRLERERAGKAGGY
jgi:phage tail-like protein